MRDRCYEISLTYAARPGIEEMLKPALRDFGVDEINVTVTTEGRYQAIKIYFDRKRRVEKFSDAVGKAGLKGIKVRVKKLATADWRDKWKEDIKPFALTPRLDVVPSWCLKDYVPKKRTPIILDTTLAFGTGIHETTRFSSQLIERCTGTFKSFLDVGTGTGLLTIVALHCGAHEVWAVDIDESSIRTAQQNLARNGLKFDWCRAMDFRKFRHKKQFDLVAANVVTDELIAMRSKIVAAVKPGGNLILSGISLGNVTRLKKAFKDQPLRCVKMLKGKKWSAMLYKKPLASSR